MTDWNLAIRTNLADLAARARTAPFQPRISDLGRVRQVGDGVAFVEGLEGAAIDEVVEFPSGVQGQIFELDRDVAACVLFGTAADIRAGDSVIRTGHTPAMPVGDALLGRVVDALGGPRDDRGPIQARERRPVDQPAPGPLDRQPIREPLLTGIKAVDAAVPIGLGQRELILGDRETGKTSVALDTLINQADRGIVGVYVSIGRKRASVVEVVDELHQHGALDHIAIVLADASEPAALRFLAPYAGCAVAEWFAYRGRHAVVVYDDLTRHAEAYRDLSLVLRRPPGREAFPGDIFSVHARLMERAFKLSDGLGGGSVTALPIIETQRGDMAGFIPTNLISMTDGQLYMDAVLFAQGHLPAIDIGRSVSRVGRDAQPGAMRDAAANLRLEIGQYEEVKGFARFGAILDEATRRQIAHGERLVRMLMQDERDVRTTAVQVAGLWALKTGLLDDVEPSAIGEFETGLRRCAPRFAAVDTLVRSARAIDGELAGELHRWVGESKAMLRSRA